MSGDEIGDLAAPGEEVAALQLPVEPGGLTEVWTDDRIRVTVLVPG